MLKYQVGKATEDFEDFETTGLSAYQVRLLREGEAAHTQAGLPESAAKLASGALGAMESRDEQQCEAVEAADEEPQHWSEVLPRRQKRRQRPRNGDAPDNLGVLIRLSRQSSQPP